MKHEYPNQKILSEFKPFNEPAELTGWVYIDCLYHCHLSIIWNFKRSILPLLTNDFFLYKFNTNKVLDTKIKQVCPLDEILYNLGVAVTVKSPPIELIRDTIKESLANNHPVTTMFDVYYEPFRFSHYQTIHQPHAFVIYGYDEHKQLFNIIENMTDNNLYYNFEMDYESFINGYDGLSVHCSINQNISKFIEYYPVNDIRFEGDYEKNVYLNKFIINIHEYKDVLIYSLKNIDKFKEAFKSIFGEKMLLESMNDDWLSDIINGILEIIKAKKSEKYRYIKLLGHESHIVGIINSIQNNWILIRNIIEKYKLTKKFNKNSFDLCVSKIQTIKEYELEFLSNLLKL